MIRVLIADQRFLRGDSIRTILHNRDGIHIANCAVKEEEVHRSLPQCDVVLISFCFIGRETINLIRKLYCRYSDVAFIVFEMPDDPELIIQFIAAGARGYVLQNETTGDLVRKIKATVKGRTLVSDRVASAMIEYINNLVYPSLTPQRNRKQITSLTPRQQEVMELVSEGLTNQEIARKLYVEYGTVKNHIHYILKKMDAANRHEAAFLYRQYHPKGGVPSYS